MKNILFALGLLLPLTACDNQPAPESTSTKEDFFTRSPNDKRHTKYCNCEGNWVLNAIHVITVYSVATKYLANIMRLNCVNNCYLFSGHDTIFDIIFFASAGVV